MKSLILTLVAVTTCLGQTSFYVGLGNSSPYTDSTGQFWQADSGCTTSTQFTSTATIQGTADPTLYQHGRSSSGNFSCTYNIQNNIYYTVTLKFANVQGVASGGRTFNIVINNQVVRSGFDIGSISNGVNAAFDLGFVVPVSNGQIAISLLTTTGGTQLNAIGITPLNSTSLTTGNFNNIRIVDGVKFAQTAAGINAADADLGSAIGEIWIPSPLVTAGDAQVSISANHTLKIFGRLTVDAVAKGPILLGNSARIICAGEAAIANITNTGVGTVPSIIRATVQDGSLQGFSVEGCSITAGAQAVTNGVIDISGITAQGWIRNNFLVGFTSGWGIFAQDIQSGALGGTNNVQIMNNQITASGTGGCIEILHSSTNAVVLSQFDILDTNCSVGASSTSSVLIQNPVASAASNLRQVSIQNLFVTGTPAAQSSLVINGVQYGSAKNVTCIGGSPTNCVNIPSNSNNLALSFDNIQCNSGCTNSLNDAANSFTIGNNYAGHYDFVATIAGYSGTYNTIYKATVANLNNIRIVDGVKFPQTAAGINAADADIGVGVGQIWVTPNAGNNLTLSDAQISIGQDHTLVLFTKINIEASASKGPILLASGAGITCFGPQSSQANIAEVTASATITSMIRLTTQDGSQVNNFVNGCNIFANSSTVTNGVIDATGFTGHGTIRDNRIQVFNSGWGIFIQDIQSGALGGTNNLQIMNNQINGSGTGGCIEITHSSTNAVALYSFVIQDINCNGGASLTTAPIVLQNLISSGNLLQRVTISNVSVNAGPAGQPGITLNGVSQLSLKGITCASGTNCVNIPSNTANALFTIDNISPGNATNALVDSANSTTISGLLLHYEFPNNAGTSSYFPAVSYLKVNGPAPASATGTGFGTGPTFTLQAGSTNNSGVVVATAGTTPTSVGTLTLNFNTNQTVFGANPPACVVTLGNGTGSWAGTAAVFTNSPSTSTAVWSWFNGGVNLTAAQTYNFTYWCAAK